MKKYLIKHPSVIISLFFLILSPVFLVVMVYQQKLTTLSTQANSIQKENQKLAKELKELKTQDQYVINQKLEKEIKDIENTYQKTVTTYEKLLDLKKDKTTSALDTLFANTLSLLAKRNYASAEAVLKNITDEIQKQNIQISKEFTIPNNIATSNTAPNSGYKRQQVKTDIGTYMIDIIAADLNSTRVVVDTASESDCKNDCPVLSLADYVSRNGAFAGINGSYFCPASYPSCAGKTNSFDTLLMNKNKKYFNSDNNVYSTVPAAIFLGNGVRFVGKSLEWGRDTSVDGVIANQPLLLSGGNITFTGSGDPKQGSKGSRSFVGAKGNMVYIGFVHNATVAEVAHVLKALGLEGALNLDSGGSTALMHNGKYIAGPGRNIPNAIVFIQK